MCQVSSQAELARQGNETGARLTQIMNLLLLAPDIQEQMLDLPRFEIGRAPVIEREVHVIAKMPNRREQRRFWGQFWEIAPVGRGWLIPGGVQDKSKFRG